MTLGQVSSTKRQIAIEPRRIILQSVNILSNQPAVNQRQEGVVKVGRTPL